MTRKSKKKYKDPLKEGDSLAVRKDGLSPATKVPVGARVCACQHAFYEVADKCFSVFIPEGIKLENDLLKDMEIFHYAIVCEVCVKGQGVELNPATWGPIH